MIRNILALFILFTIITQAAVFNRVNTVINTPAARQGTIGQFEMGLSFAPYYVGPVAYWEEDFYVNYHVTDFLIMGVTRVNAFDYAGNLQLLLAKDVLVDKLNFAFGVENIASNETASTFDTLQEKYPNNMSLYVVGTYKVDQWELSAGIGGGRLANFYNPYTVVLSNLFYSASYYFSNEGENVGRFSFDYDSKDFNIGIVLPIHEKLELQLALTQLPFRAGNNPGYGDIPYQNVSVGIVFKQNFFNFYGEEYANFSDKLKDVDEKSGIIGEKYSMALNNADKSEKLIRDLKKDKDKLTTDVRLMIKDLRKEKDQLQNEVKALRDVIEADGFKKVVTLKEDIMRHYYKALRHYYNEEYFSAIEELTKANMINNRIPEVHIRLGSIYYTLGLYNEAKRSWGKAYALDQNNEEFNAFLKEKNISFGGPKK